mmetsp:Transcript_14134/g.31877  ORF Transcript_14134/g.31877 Transcript_14134/m.31877 type:complete len:452 (+) Transcript_14134:47-1402(+)
MPLPPLIEVEPLSQEQLSAFKTTKATVTIPGSKSITNRAIVLAALGDGVVTLKGALWSEDTEAMCDCMTKLGVEVKVSPDPDVESNRLIEVKGCSGKIPNAGTAEAPLELYVANAGTAARFLSAMVCLGNGVFRLSGVPRMHERPQAELLRALRALGYQIETPNDKLPAVFYGGGPKPGAVTVSVEESSQFASALLLSSCAGKWEVSTPEGANPDELPYVEMTRRLLEVFPTSGGTFQIEPDASSASYFHAVNAMFPSITPVEVLACQPPKQAGGSGWQIDADFPELAPVAGTPAKKVISRKLDLGDSIMTAIAIAPLASTDTTFVELGVLRRQECERVEALRTELTKCGAKVTETGDTLVIAPSSPDTLGNASVATYHDHRMAMCLATLALAVKGIKIQDPRCVRKTVPSFFQMLAASPPQGLGVKIWECDETTGERKRELKEPADLFAA